MAEHSSDRDLPGVDLERLQDYLHRELPDLLAGPLHANMVPGGRSNLTYLLDDGQRQFVLRRPPLGHVLATAHDMGREYKVITALASTEVPVPRTYVHCEDEDVLGAPFFLMDYVQGRAIRSREECAELSEAQRGEIATQLTDVLARLHEVDDAQVGLGDFGRPQGFLERQVNRWGKQLDSSRSRDLDGVDELRDWLAGHLPQTQAHTIVHGDYRLDNALVGTDPLRITAVLDWEMATRGDPLTDLGLFSVYWHGTGDGDDPADPITEGVTAMPGFPSFAELTEQYATRTGYDLSTLDWYVAFGYFKLAVVLEGIYYRYTQGQTVGEGFDKIGERVPQTVRKGLESRGGH